MKQWNYNWNRWKKTKNLIPLSDRTLKEMRYIVDGIMDGSLNHNQGVWHSDEVWRGANSECGTAHCMAGWCEALYLKAKAEKKGFFSVGKKITEYVYRKLRLKHRTNTMSTIRDRWGLSSTEAELLFYCNNTKEDLDDFVVKFEKGYRYV